MDIKNVEFEKILRTGVLEYGLNLTDEHIDKLIKYKELLKEWNKKINLTAIEDDKDIAIKHFIDSFSVNQYIDIGDTKIIDVGTGAGFPGIPLKIVNSRLDITLLDSLDKRIKFLDLVIENLELDKICAVHGRAEDLGILDLHREKYDICVARAVASLPVLLEYCLPLVRVGGIFIAMKGSNIEELEESQKALSLLGGEIKKIDEIHLPFTNNVRKIIIIRKFRHTPTKYPRKAGKPSKQPLI